MKFHWRVPYATLFVKGLFCSQNKTDDINHKMDSLVLTEGDSRVTIEDSALHQR